MKHSIGYQINRTAYQLKAELLKQFSDEGFDVTPEQWQLLNLLWKEDGVNQKQLSEVTFKDSGNISRMLDVLQKRGYITKCLDENDRRYFRIHLTNKGLALKQPMTSIANNIIETAQKNITQEEIDLLIRLLNQIHDNLSRK
ncbi:MarR family winged helix-turn-helix transcriptional regulator [Lysinibacillus capsici]